MSPMFFMETVFTHSSVAAGTVDSGHDTISVGLAVVAFIEFAVCIFWS